MIPGTLNLTVYKGSTFGPIVITALDTNDDPVDLTGWFAHWKVRERPESPVIFDLQPTITDGPGGVITAPAITDEVTETMPRGRYVQDLLLERPGGEVLGPFLTGSFTVQSSVSRA